MMTAWIAVLAMAGLALALHLKLSKKLGVASLIGDEGEYLQRGSQADPFAPTHFLRVPLMGLLAMLACRKGRDVSAFRKLILLQGLFAVGCVSIAGFLMAGWPGLIGAGFVFVMLPERAMLSDHLWPDTPLSLWMALWIVVALCYAPGGAHHQLIFWLLGCIAMLCFLTRFDAIVVTPAALLGFLIYDYAAWPQFWLPLLLPTIIAFGFLSVFNGLRYGIWFPDNTSFFNLTLLIAELDQNKQEKTIEKLVKHTKVRWDKDTDAVRLRRGIGAIVRSGQSPWTSLQHFCERLLGFCGRETFITQKMLNPQKGAYRQADPSTLRFLQCWLHLAFPLLLGLTIGSFVLTRGNVPLMAWPTVALFFASFAFHMRTRYRVALLPGLTLTALSNWSQFSTTPGTQQIAAGISSVLVFIVLISINVRQEVPVTS